MHLLIKSTEFFKNLPPKKCAECEREIAEQHECYGNKCDSCIRVVD
ncbi:YhfH family protein [Bacillus timonensis]|nr:YhfH family protein [Bacillus timonensis]